jgi:hypothetical protein
VRKAQMLLWSSGDEVKTFFKKKKLVHLLKRFYLNIHSDEMDCELFKIIKKILFTDLSDQNNYTKR